MFFNKTYKNKPCLDMSTFVVYFLYAQVAVVFIIIS